MNCKKCGKPIKDGAAFCGNCGEPVIVHEKTDYQDNHLSYVIIQKSNNVAENKKSIENTGYHNPDSKAKPPNSKWPLSVRILMTISLIILIVEFPCLKTAGSFSYRYSGWYDALPFISSIIAIIYFFISKKRVLLSIVPLFFDNNLVSFMGSTHLQTKSLHTVNYCPYCFRNTLFRLSNIAIK